MFTEYVQKGAWLTSQTLSKIVLKHILRRTFLFHWKPFAEGSPGTSLFSYMLTEVHWLFFCYHFLCTLRLSILPLIHIADGNLLHICFFHISLSLSTTDLRTDSCFVFWFDLHHLNRHSWFRISAFVGFFALWLSSFHRQPFRGNHLAQWSTVMVQLLCSSVQSAHPHHPEQHDSD